EMAGASRGGARRRLASHSERGRGDAGAERRRIAVRAVAVGADLATARVRNAQSLRPARGRRAVIEEIRVPGRLILPVEIAINDRQFEALSRAGAARHRVRFLHRLAREPGLARASARAAVAVQLVAVVALLAFVDVAVPAMRVARARG